MDKVREIVICLEFGRINCNLKKIEDMPNTSFMCNKGLAIGTVDFTTHKLKIRKDIIDEDNPWYDLVKVSNTKDN